MLTPLAEAGSIEAQNELSHMYWYGEGTEAAYETALKWSRMAAQQGDPTAQYDIGIHYVHGRGVPKDLVVAVDWFMKAAMQGDSSAQRNLAVAYGLGQGVPKDREVSYRWLTAAALNPEPNALAQVWLAQAFLSASVEHEVGGAVKLLRDAAAAREASAALLLGRIHLGLWPGAPIDEQQAYRWLILAERLGCMNVGTLLAQAGAGLTEAEMAEAVGWTAQWDAAHPERPGHMHPVKPEQCDTPLGAPI